MGGFSPHAPFQWLCPLWLLRVAGLGSYGPHLINRALGEDAGGALCWAILERDTSLQCAWWLYWDESGLSGLL